MRAVLISRVPRRPASNASHSLKGFISAREGEVQVIFQLPVKGAPALHTKYMTCFLKQLRSVARVLWRLRLTVECAAKRCTSLGGSLTEPGACERVAEKISHGAARAACIFFARLIDDSARLSPLLSSLCRPSSQGWTFVRCRLALPEPR